MTLRGEVNFPTLEIDQSVIDFGTIYNGTEAVEEVSVTNGGPFCVTFKWYIKPNSTSIQQSKVYEHTQVLLFFFVSKFLKNISVFKTLKVLLCNLERKIRCNPIRSSEICRESNGWH